MKPDHRLRRLLAIMVLVAGICTALLVNPDMYQSKPAQTPDLAPVPLDVGPKLSVTSDANEVLNQLPVKGRAAKTDYSRKQFGDGWELVDGCDTRNIILNRDLVNVVTNEKCQVVTGILHDPYTGKIIAFTRGEFSSQAVQIDHVVALSNAWQTGAQLLTYEQRENLANDPLELLAVDGTANQEKSAADAATWLPPNKTFRCQYIARQIAVKAKYSLWVTPPEKEAMVRILETCPEQTLPISGLDTPAVAG